MLGSALPAPASVTTNVSPASAATTVSPTRPSRLRRLSYLRSYTQHHLHSHSNTANSSRADAPSLSRSTSSPAPETPHHRSRAPSAQDSERSAAVSVTSATIQSGEHGWLPTVQGRSGLDRESLQPTSTSTDSALSESIAILAPMVRSRAATDRGSASATPSAPSTHRRQSAVDGSAAMNGVTPDTTEPSASTAPTPSRESLPTIRFIPHIETRSARPSLHFSAISRTLKTPKTVVRVGRYSERDLSSSPDPDVIAVGFKSKVVSRRHCEFWCTNGQWYVRDVKSSSGTFLNHVRLSSPGTESRPFQISDGDVVQLGIDFKGGEEVIFRCVKIRIECNRGWQKSLNAFNTSAHKRLLQYAQAQQQPDQNTSAAPTNNGECAICLVSIAPCQALFVAPCSHVWHYKCVVNLVNGPHYPNFICPNCRFVADLEAEVDMPDEYEAFDENDEDAQSGEKDDRNKDTEAQSVAGDGASGQTRQSTESQRRARDCRDTVSADEIAGLMDQTSLGDYTPPALPLMSIDDHTSTREITPLTNPGTPSPSNEDVTLRTQPVPITSTRTASSPSQFNGARSTTPTSHAAFAIPGVSEGGLGPIGEATILDVGPLTPRNDAGPFVLDGSAGRERRSEGIAGVERVLNGETDDSSEAHADDEKP